MAGGGRQRATEKERERGYKLNPRRRETNDEHEDRRRRKQDDTEGSQSRLTEHTLPLS